MQKLESAVRDIQLGNGHKLDELINSQRLFIYNYACCVCKRKLQWQNDDELSIALIAFNRAVDTYDGNHETSFIQYARHLIRNSLIDHFRRQNKEKHAALYNLNGEGGAESSEEAKASWKRYLFELENRERAYEVKVLEKELDRVGLTFTTLARHSPRHLKTRETIKEAARKIADRPELAGQLDARQKMPLSEMAMVTGINKKTLQKWRKYLLSLIVILTSDDMDYLVEYIWGRGAGESEKSKRDSS